MTVLAVEAAPIAAEALGGGAAAAGESAAAGGAGEGVSRVASKISAKRPVPPTARGGRGAASRGSGSKGKGAFGGVTGSASQALAGGGTAHKLVIAEFILCVMLIGFTPILSRQPNNGHLYAANDFVRLSAVCLLFFTLALLSNGGKSAKFAAAFGALVTLGVLYNSTGALNAVGAIFTNSYQNKGTVAVAAADTTVIADAPTYQGVNLGGVPIQQAAGGAAGFTGPPGGGSGTGAVSA